MAAPRVRGWFRRRTTALLTGLLASCGLLAVLGAAPGFWVAVALLVMWGLVFAATMPIRQAYMNGLIPSEQRATVLSFDNLLDSGGAVVLQPALGRVADAWSFSGSYLAGAAIQLLAAPLMVLARGERPQSDLIVPAAAPAPDVVVQEPATPAASRAAA